MNKLVRQYTLDKLVGPDSNQYLARNPDVINSAIETRELMTILQPSLSQNVGYQTWYLLNPLFYHIYQYLEIE